MDELETPLTPVEASRAATGFRYYVCEKTTYGQLAAAVDASRGYPKQYTKRGLPLVEELPEATDGSGKVLIAIDCWRFNADDDAMLEAPTAAGLVTELTKDDYDALKPEPSNEFE